MPNRRSTKVKGYRPPSLALIAAATLATVATIPYGSASLSAKNLSVACALLLTAACLVVRPPTEASSSKAKFTLLAVFAAVAWLGWMLVYLIPFPTSLHQFFGTAHLRHPIPTHASLPLALNPQNVFTQWAYTCGLLGLAWIAARFATSQKNLRLLAGFLFASGCLQAVVGVLQMDANSVIENSFYRTRLVGTFSSPNTFAGYLSLTLLSGIGLLLMELQLLIGQANRKWRILLDPKRGLQKNTLGLCLISGGILLQAAALLLSGSRGAILATLVSILLLLIAVIKQPFAAVKRRTIVLALILITGCSVVAIGGTFNALLNRFSADQSFQLSDAEATPRNLLNQASLNIISQHPWGVGPGCYREAIPGYQPESMAPARTRYAHNDYLQILVETGIPGGILALFLLFFFLRALLTTYRQASGKPSTQWLVRAFCLAVLASMAHALFEFNLSSRPGVAFSFALLSGTVFAVPRKSNREKKSTERRSSLPLRALLITGCIFTCVVLIRKANQDIHMEKQVAALGLPTDPYTWWTTQDSHAPDPAEMIEIGLAQPGQVLSMIRSLKYYYYEQQQLAAAALRSSQPGLSNTQIAQFARAAIAKERSDSLLQLLKTCEATSQHQPGNPDLALQLATLYIEAEKSGSHPHGLSLATNLMAYAEHMAPNDAYTHSELTHLWTDIHFDYARLPSQIASTQVLKHGSRALQLGFRSVDYVIADMRRAELSLAKITAAATYPPSVYPQLISSYETALNFEEALLFYHEWIRLLRTPEAFATYFRNEIKRREFENISQHKYLRTALLARNKVILLHQKYEHYRAARDEVAEYISSRNASELDSLSTYPAGRKLALEEFYSTSKLAIEHQAELIRRRVDVQEVQQAEMLFLQLALGKTQSQMIEKSALLNDLIYGQPPPIPLMVQVGKLLTEPPTDTSQLGELVDRVLVTLNARQRERFEHRLYLLAAQQLDKNGELVAAAEYKRRAHARAPNDPDTRPEQGTASTSETLHTIHGSGHFEITGVSISQAPLNTTARPAIRVTTSIRIWAPLDRNIQFRVFLRSPGIKGAKFVKGMVLSKLAAGSPATGETIDVTVDIPAEAFTGTENICLGFLQAKQKSWYPSIDGLPYITLGYPH